MAIKEVSTILNTIRATSSNAYQTAVPLTTADNITDVGKAVLGLPDTEKNEFINAVNKIGLTIINSANFKNHLTFLKKGNLEYGSSIEDIFIKMVKSIPYIAGTRDGETPPDQFEIFKTENDVAYYTTQFERQYPQTFHEHDVKRAFRSAEAFGEWIVNMANALQSAIEWDDYRVTVALMARQVEAALTDTETKWHGEVKLVSLYNEIYNPTPAITADTALLDKDFLTFMSNQIQKWSNRLNYVREDVNIAGVANGLPKANQRIMMLGDIKADLDTNLFAWAYNQDKLQIGGFDEIDTWYSIGANGESEVVASPDDIKVKADLGVADEPVIGVMYDKEMLKIYNKFYVSRTTPNNRGLYYNNFTTMADIYACSPFHNFVVFTLA